MNCFVSPHLLNEIVRRGDESQRSWALENISVAGNFRGRRDVLTNVPNSLPTGEKIRTVYDAQNKQIAPGTLVLKDGDPPSADPAVNEAYEALGHAYDFFDEVYERKSVDAHGARLDATVHFGVSFDNGIWDGREMVYGDGDGKLFTRFTAPVEVTGHEFTHGVTQHAAGLVYFGQSGALNESLSDVFGSLIKQRLLGQKADEADWLIGPTLIGPEVKGIALRSLKAPGTAYDDPVLGKDPQPAHIKDFRNMTDDGEGIHINSGIPNHAFYLVATEIGGYAWEKAGRIWFVTLRDRLIELSNFQDAASLTTKVAGDLYGDNSPEQKAVINGWTAVGVPPELNI